jgi:hypothetical protein
LSLSGFVDMQNQGGAIHFVVENVGSRLVLDALAHHVQAKIMLRGICAHLTMTT